eukprot:Gb_01681 [translate_table: standard]
MISVRRSSRSDGGEFDPAVTKITKCHKTNWQRKNSKENSRKMQAKKTKKKAAKSTEMVPQKKEKSTNVPNSGLPWPWRPPADYTGFDFSSKLSNFGLPTLFYRLRNFHKHFVDVTVSYTPSTSMTGIIVGSGEVFNANAS